MLLLLGALLVSDAELLFMLGRPEFGALAMPLSEFVVPGAP